MLILCLMLSPVRLHSAFFFFNDTATTEIYTLSLHDALPISVTLPAPPRTGCPRARRQDAPDRKSTRLNSSHQKISYAVVCLKKKNTVSAGSSNPNLHDPPPSRLPTVHPP